MKLTVEELTTIANKMVAAGAKFTTTSVSRIMTELAPVVPERDYGRVENLLLSYFVTSDIGVSKALQPLAEFSMSQKLFLTYVFVSEAIATIGTENIDTAIGAALIGLSSASDDRYATPIGICKHAREMIRGVGLFRNENIRHLVQAIQLCVLAPAGVSAGDWEYISQRVMSETVGNKLIADMALNCIANLDTTTGDSLLIHGAYRAVQEWKAVILETVKDQLGNDETYALPA